jgi:MerR family transcriptional regulator, copper efflux regulator
MDKVKHEPQDHQPASAVSIGRAAAATGLSPKAVRLYEARGLLAAPTRTAAGYRLYTDAEIARLRFIAAARQLGLHVDQVAEILDAAHDGQRPCATTHQLLDRRIGEIDRVIAELSTLRATLTAARQTPAADTDPAATICPVVENPRLYEATPTRRRRARRHVAPPRARSSRPGGAASD